MDYQRIYKALIERARGRVLAGYKESHHIIPRCMGGTDGVENLADLTPEEHYVAHQLLVRLHPGHAGLLWAASAMTGNGKRNQRANKLYGWLRRQFAERIGAASRGRVYTAEQRKKMADARRGMKRQPHTDETKRKMSMASKGRPKSQAHREAMSRQRTGVKRGPHSDETKEKIRLANQATHRARDKSVYLTDEYRQKQAAKMREVWAKRKQLKESK